MIQMSPSLRRSDHVVAFLAYTLGIQPYVNVIAQYKSDIQIAAGAIACSINKNYDKRPYLPTGLH